MHLLKCRVDSLLYTDVHEEEFNNQIGGKIIVHLHCISCTVSSSSPDGVRCVLWPLTTYTSTGRRGFPVSDVAVFLPIGGSMRNSTRDGMITLTTEYDYGVLWILSDPKGLTVQSIKKP